jgi:hypothetical protein
MNRPSIKDLWVISSDYINLDKLNKLRKRFHEIISKSTFIYKDKPFIYTCAKTFRQIEKKDFINIYYYSMLDKKINDLIVG